MTLMTSQLASDNRGVRFALAAAIIMVVIEVTNLSGVLAGRVPLPVFPASMALGAVALGLAIRNPLLRSKIDRTTVFCACLILGFLVTQLLSTLGSTDLSASLSAGQSLFVDSAFVILVLLLIRVTQRPWAVAAAIVASFAALSVLTVVNEVIFGGTTAMGGFATVTEASGQAITTLRYGGPLPDSNFWGRHLVLALPLAAALVVRAWRSKSYIALTGWSLSTVALLGGVYLTQSRGTFVATAVCALAWVVLSGGRIRRWGLVCIPLAAAAAFLVPGIGNRITAAVADIVSPGIDYGLDASLIGRAASQEMAWLMFGDRPLFGYGPASFTGHIEDLAGLVPTAVTAPPTDQLPIEAPHNLYLQLAAESGIVGLTGWLVMVIGFLGLLLLRIAADPRSRDRVLVAAVCAAVIAWSVASVALHLSYFRTFGVMLALVPALAASWPAATEALRDSGHTMAVWCVAGIAGLASGWGYTVLGTEPAVAATQQMTVRPVGEVDGYYAYGLDLRSRTAMLPTFATLLQDPDRPATVVADPVRGVLAFSVTAVDRQLAQHELQALVSRAGTLFDGSVGRRQYQLVPVGGVDIGSTVHRAWYLPIGAVTLGVGTAFITGAVLGSVPGRRRPGQSRSVSPAGAVR